MIRSNANICDEDMASVADWFDGDVGTGASAAVTFDSKSCLKLDSGGTATGTTTAARVRDVGALGTRTVLSFPLYCDTLDAYGSGDIFIFGFSNGTYIMNVIFASDGLFIYDGATYNEVGTNIVAADTWQEWTFDIDWTGATTDVYLDGVSQDTDVDISCATATPDGYTEIRQDGHATTYRISYIDWWKVGDGFATSIKAYNGVADASIKKASGVALASVSKIMGLA